MKHPEFEHPFSRDPSLGYEAPDESTVIHCVAHGFPSPLARWHCHDEYELHLIIASAGRAFVGDYIGDFEPGHLVLTGPRLPHNWISYELPAEGLKVRDLGIQFPHAPIEAAMKALPEMAEVLPLLERARHGIEFFGLADAAQAHWHHVKGAKGLARLTAFCQYMTDLVRCKDYRLLSHAHVLTPDENVQFDLIDAVMHRVLGDLAKPVSMQEMASSLGMGHQQFARLFRRSTGGTLTDFVNRIRVNYACKLLMESDHTISRVCYEAGFNNVSNFNRRFMEIKGITPSGYRKLSHNRFGQKH
nr:AraC family transcriptional regulator [Ramlibacter tataouinensis]